MAFSDIYTRLGGGWLYSPPPPNTHVPDKSTYSEGNLYNIVGPTAFRIYYTCIYWFYLNIWGLNVKETRMTTSMISITYAK